MEMSSFTNKLILSPLSDGKKWVLRKEFSYDIGEIGSGDTITVPTGFVTDLASVPRIFWSILPPWENYGPAAVIHDYLYFSHEKTKAESDYIFYEGMMVLKVPTTKAKIIYNSVKIFGKNAYEDNNNYIIEPSGDYIKIPHIEL
jgi:hypothetical protein